MQSETQLSGGKKIILFDGICNLCNGAVDFIIRHDKNDVFRFASLQSELAKNLATERGVNLSEIDSIMLIIPREAYFIQSSAALEIAKELSAYRWMRIFLYLPRGFRDAVYAFIANHRYQWFGKKSQCRMPTPELLEKFLE